METSWFNRNLIELCSKNKAVCNIKINDILEDNQENTDFQEFINFLSPRIKCNINKFMTNPNFTDLYKSFIRFRKEFFDFEFNENFFNINKSKSKHMSTNIEINSRNSFYNELSDPFDIPEVFEHNRIQIQCCEEIINNGLPNNGITMVKALRSKTLYSENNLIDTEVPYEIGFVDSANVILSAIIYKYMGNQGINVESIKILANICSFVPKTLLMAYILLSRYFSAQKTAVTFDNLKNLFFACCVICNKLRSDFNLQNLSMIQNTGLSISELNYLEAFIINIVNYDLGFTTLEYKNTISEIFQIYINK